MTDAAPRHASTGVLARLVGDVADFAAHRWGRDVLLRPGSRRPGDGGPREGYPDLLTLDGIDELVSVRGLRAPFLRLVKDGGAIPERAYLGGGGIGAAVADQARDDGVHQQMLSGATLVLQGLHRVWPPLLEFAQDLAADLGHPTQVNAYVTPPQSRGFAAHEDDHDVFVLQLSGQKRWYIHDPVLPLPLPGRSGPGHAQAVAARANQDPRLDVVLAPGDCLYLPRGYLHSARALGGVSAHLTVGVHAWTRDTVLGVVLGQVRAALAEEEQMRASLPVGVDLADPAVVEPYLDIAREAVLRALSDADPARVAAELTAAAARGQRPAPLRPFAQLAAARDLGPGDRVVLRDHLALRREPTEAGGVRLIGRNGRVTIPPSESPGMAQVLTGEPVASEDLVVDEEAGMRLLRRLLDAGVVVPLR